MNATAERPLSDPAAVQARLELIEARLADLQNDVETAALEWFREKKAREQLHAETFLRSEGTVAERNAAADLAVAERRAELVQADDEDPEGRYEALRAVSRVLDTRAAIGMSILRSQGRWSA